MSQTPEPAAGIDFTAWLENLRRDVSETVNGITLRGARAVQVGTGGTQRPTTAAGALVGFALCNTSAVTPAEVELRDGRDAGGNLLMTVTLAEGESTRDWFGPGGINLTEGLHVAVTSGAVEGTVFLRGVE